MTLKHQNECTLTITTSGLDSSQFSDHEIEIKYANRLPWRSLGTGATMTWTTKVAGNFSLRAKATANGQTYTSAEQAAKVQFPSRVQIWADAVVYSAMNSAWQDTLADSTETSYIEHGFLIKLNTQTDTYSIDSSDYLAQAVDPGVEARGEFMYTPDNLEDIGAASSGATYTVAFFHTHPPFTYANPEVYESRDTGPSDDDLDNATDIDLPGLLYDYTDLTIDPGHSEDDDAGIEVFGPERRSTP